MEFIFSVEELYGKLCGDYPLLIQSNNCIKGKTIASISVQIKYSIVPKYIKYTLNSARDCYVSLYTWHMKMEYFLLEFMECNKMFWYFGKIRWRKKSQFKHKILDWRESFFKKLWKVSYSHISSLFSSLCFLLQKKILSSMSISYLLLDKQK